jgi:hypothetical protein
MAFSVGARRFDPSCTKSGLLDGVQGVRRARAGRARTKLARSEASKFLTNGVNFRGSAESPRAAFTKRKAVQILNRLSTGRGEKIRTSDPLTPRPVERAQQSATACNDTQGEGAVQGDAGGCSGALPFPAAFSDGVPSLPAGETTVLDLVCAVDDAIMRGDLHVARQLLATLAEQLAVTVGSDNASDG